MTRREIFDAALALPKEDRARLRDELDATLEVPVEPELLEVLEKRRADFARGVPDVPADEMMARLRRRYWSGRS